MSADRHQDDDALSLQVTRQVDQACDEFEAALRLGDAPIIELYLDRVEIAGRKQLIKELALLAVSHFREQGSANPIADLLNVNPTLRQEIHSLVQSANDVDTVSTDSAANGSAKASGLVIRCPHCHNTIALIVDASLVDIGCQNCGGTFSLVNEAEVTRDATTFSTIAHFELVERLGMGEFGTVWKARDTILDRTVALKIPRRERLDAVSIEKFMREARAAAQLRHPYIVSTHEVGRDADTLYIVSDYIRGVSLAEMIADHLLGIRDSVALTVKVAEALQHAHESGVIHRDLKPSNILVDDRGEPHLMDFGLAKRKETEVTITTDGAILGTPAYMPPEQARGEASRVDGRSDIYSLGVILFQLLTGELPFRGSMRMLLQKVINDDPPAPRTLDGRVPKDLDTICLKCLEKDPARRYATAGDLAADLRRWMLGEPITARRIGMAGRASRWARRNRAVSSLLAATILTLLMAAVSSSYFAWRAAQNAARADQQAINLTDTLYDSLLQEIRLTREVRLQGYGEKITYLVNKALQLGTTHRDKNVLRRELGLTMGDFVAYSPTIITPGDGEVSAICLSNDGKQVFAGLSDGRLLVYDTASGSVISELETFPGALSSMAVGPRGNELITADKTGTVRRWKNINTEWQVDRVIVLGNDPDWVFMSRHGEFAGFTKGNLLDVWDLDSGKKLRSLATESDWSIKNGAIDTSQRRLAAGFLNERAGQAGWALWNIDMDDRLQTVELPSLGGTYVNGLALADADSLMAIGFDEALLTYELNSLQQSRFSGLDSIKAVAFSPTHAYLAAFNIRGRITIWNSATNRQIATLQFQQPKLSRNQLSFSSDGGQLAACNADSIQIWDLTKADEKKVMTGHRSGIPCVAFRPDGQLLASGGKDEELRFWNPSTGQLVGSLNLGSAVQALAFSADGRILAAGCTGPEANPNLRLIDVASIKVIDEFVPSLGEVYSLSWAESQRGIYLSGCGANGVVLWKVNRGESIRLEAVFDRKASWCLKTVLNRDARLMVWAEEERQLKAWDVVAGREITLHAPEMLQGWHGLAFRPDGESVTYVSGAGVAEVWNVVKDQRVESFARPGTFVAPHISVSPNGKWLAALTQADSLSVWSLATGQQIISMRPEAGSVWALAWDDSSKQLAVGQSDGGLAVWHLPKIQKKLAQLGLSWQADK